MRPHYALFHHPDSLAIEAEVGERPAVEDRSPRRSSNPAIRSADALHEIGLTLNAGNVWLKAGAMSGPATGALRAWAARRGGFVVAWSVVALVVFEPLVVYLTYLASDGRFAAGDGQWNGVYAAEAGLGTVAAVALWGTRPISRD